MSGARLLAAAAVICALQAMTALAQPAQERLQQRENALLGAPLSQDSAAELALLHHPTVTRGLAILGIEEANRLAMAHTLPRARSRGAVDADARIERPLTINALGWLMQAILATEPALASAHVRAGAAEEIGVVLFTARRAFINAMTAMQEAALQERLVTALQATHDLAQQMRRVGNASNLESLRAERSLAEALGRQTVARAHAAIERERLAHALGLWGQHIERMQLPTRLPDLPGSTVGAEGLEARAIAERWDLRRLRAAIDAGNGAVVDASAHEADHGPLPAQLDEMAVRARAEVRTAWIAYRAAYDLARHARDRVVPVAKRISEEMLLRYNGMLVSVFALLADAAEQANVVKGALHAERDFWLAEVDLQQAIAGIGIVHAGAHLKGQGRGPSTRSHHETH
jgi:outer membrane protein, multidrug efflux system